jgi:hypothetical protein
MSDEAPLLSESLRPSSLPGLATARSRPLVGPG